MNQQQIQGEDPFERALKVKCRDHGTVSEFIFVTIDQVQHRICSTCLKQKKLENEQILVVKELLESTEDSIFQNFPPLSDNNLQQKLNLVGAYSLRQMQDKANQFFFDFKSQFDQLIERQKAQVKQILDEIGRRRKRVCEVYNQISSKNQLKQEIFDSAISSNEKKVHQILVDKFNQEKNNGDKIRESVLSFEDVVGTFNLDSAEVTKRKALKIIEEMTFFLKKDILEFIEFLPDRTYDSLFHLETSRIENVYQQIYKNEVNGINNFILQNNHYLNKCNRSELKQSIVLPNLQSDKISSSFKIEKIQRPNWWSIARSEQPLSKRTRYLFRFTYEQNSEDRFPGFEVRLTKDLNGKKSTISYLEYSGKEGNINKIIKGTGLSSGESARYIKKSFEMRVHIAGRVLKLADHPLYLDIVEIDDKNLLEDQGIYYLEYLLKQVKDTITIYDSQIVGDFDKKM